MMGPPTLMVSGTRRTGCCIGCYLGSGVGGILHGEHLPAIPTLPFQNCFPRKAKSALLLRYVEITEISSCRYLKRRIFGFMVY